jgi:hypothetical protein
MREVNDRIFELMSETWSLTGEMDSGTGQFLCECSDGDCVETVQLTLREYAALQQAEDRSSLRLEGHPH